MRIFRFQGSLDQSNILDRLTYLGRALNCEPRLGLDLSAVTAIDTAGLAGLARLLADARRRGGEVLLTGASDAVCRALALARLEPLFPIRKEAA